MVAEFLFSESARTWPDLRAVGPVMYDETRELWAQDAEYDGGEALLVLFHGKIYVVDD